MLTFRFDRVLIFKNSLPVSVVFSLLQVNSRETSDYITADMTRDMPKSAAIVQVS